MSLVVLLLSMLDEPAAVAAELAAAVHGHIEEVRADARVHYRKHVLFTDGTSLITYGALRMSLAADGRAANLEIHARTFHGAVMFRRDHVADAASEPRPALVGHPVLEILHGQVG